MDDLIRMEAFKEIIQKDTDWQEEYSKMIDEQHEKLQEVYEKEPKDSSELDEVYLEWRRSLNTLQRETDEKTNEMMKKWFIDHYKSEPPKTTHRFEKLFNFFQMRA